MAVITEEAIRELAAFRGEEAPVTTCYLDVDGRRFVRHQDYEHELDLLLRSAKEKANGTQSVAEDLRRIEEYVKGGFDRSTTRGLAFFACSAHDLFEVVPMPVPVRSRVIVNSAPAVGQLEQFVQDYDRFGVLLVDKQRARMFVFDLGALIDYSELFEELPRDYDTRGHSARAGYDRDQQHVADLASQHLRHAAQVAFHVYQERGFEHFAVAAPDPIAPEIEALLHPYLRDRYCGRLAIGANASGDEIRTATMNLEAEVDRRHEAERVAKLRDTIGSGGRAVAGLEPVLRALGERRVETLMVSGDFSTSGWRCTSCQALATVGRTCPVCASAMEPLEDVVEEAVEDALVQGIKVDLCTGNADLDVLGRIGAMLRY